MPFKLGQDILAADYYGEPEQEVPLGPSQADGYIFAINATQYALNVRFHNMVEPWRVLPLSQMLIPALGQKRFYFDVIEDTGIDSALTWVRFEWRERRDALLTLPQAMAFATNIGNTVPVTVPDPIQIGGELPPVQILPGQAIGLDPATVLDLQQVTVQNPVTSVALDAPTVASLQTVTVQNPVTEVSLPTPQIESLRSIVSMPNLTIETMPPVTANVSVDVTARSVVATQFPTGAMLGDICYRSDQDVEFRCVQSDAQGMGPDIWRSEKFLLPFTDAQNKNSTEYYQSSAASFHTMRAAIPILPSTGTQIPTLQIAGVRYFWEGDQHVGTSHLAYMHIFDAAGTVQIITSQKAIPIAAGTTAQYVDDAATYSMSTTARQILLFYSRTGLISATQRFFLRSAVWVRWEYQAP